MTTTFVFCQYVNLSCEFLVWVYCTWFSENLSSFDFISLNTTKKTTDVITSLSFVKEFTEHFDTSYNYFTCFFFNTNDFYFIRKMQNTSFYTACSNCTTTCDREYVFDWHKEWLICITLWIWDIAIYCIHKFHDLVAPFAVWIFKSFKSGTFDDWAIIEVILFKNFCDFHFY